MIPDNQQTERNAVFNTHKTKRSPAVRNAPCVRTNLFVGTRRKNQAHGTCLCRPVQPEEGFNGLAIAWPVLLHQVSQLIHRAWLAEQETPLHTTERWCNRRFIRNDDNNFSFFRFLFVEWLYKNGLTQCVFSSSTSRLYIILRGYVSMVLYFV